ncbi:dihydrolipoyl dehydrogenase family protein [Robertkochia aurantiaca]|uniref:dihydrolipoyl dehydrogenase family protein n=1 Tax=Robertkochia aurantiaca TaxID=2873700 RepID=UPI001CC92350|nr:NAD(P)/FAD-dependent oxidoreductase [Robertkochia sp. 3YJGBD-33]
MKEFDVFVIGSGMAGMTVAKKCASEGLSVGITDERPYGGTCALRGCDPKKVLTGVTEVFRSAQNLQHKGLEGIPSLNWKDLMRFKSTFTDSMPGKIEKDYKDHGIITFHSQAKFLDPNTIELNETRVKAKKIILATGARPRTLNIPGGEYTLTSTDFLNLKELPKSLLFIGGGYIAFEFAHIAARFGAKVTIVHRGEHPLAKFDHNIVKHLVSATEKLGIDIVLNTEVTEVQKSEKGFLVTVENKNGKNSYPVSAVFNSSGRVPAIDDLDLEKAGIAYNKKGIEVNDYLQSTSNTHIYSAGDSAVTNGLPLTPVAVLEGHVVASNVIGNNHKKMKYPAIPSVVFTLPPVAMVGMTEREANDQDLSFETKYESVPGWFNAKRTNQDEYAFKTLIDKESDRILGAHLIGPHAEETINLFAMAMNADLKTHDLKKMLYSYPSMASDISSMI